jgi:hypothetical protein
MARSSPLSSSCPRFIVVVVVTALTCCCCPGRPIICHITSNRSSGEIALLLWPQVARDWVSEFQTAILPGGDQPWTLPACCMLLTLDPAELLKCASCLCRCCCCRLADITRLGSPRAGEQRGHEPQYPRITPVSSCHDFASFLSHIPSNILKISLRTLTLYVRAGFGIQVFDQVSQRRYFCRSITDDDQSDCQGIRSLNVLKLYAYSVPVDHTVGSSMLVVHQ